MEFFSRERTIKLIRLYETQRLLWDKYLREYRDRNKRKEAYEYIARELGIDDTEEIRRKMGSLLIQFRRERRSFANGERKSNWWGFRHFQFLIDRDALEVNSNVDELIGNLDYMESNYKEESEGDIVSVTPTITERTTALTERIDAVFPCASSSTSESSVFGASGLSKRRKEQVEETQTILTNCLKDILQDQKRDEHTVYGESVANRLRNIKDPKRLCLLRNRIDNIIFESEMAEHQRMEMTTPNTMGEGGEKEDEEEIEKQTIFTTKQGQTIFIKSEVLSDTQESQ